MGILTCLCSTCYVQGLGKAVMYCGDGINDLAALAVAGVGMAISSSNAAAAATVFDRRASVAGASISCTQGQSLFTVLPIAARNRILDASVALAEATVAMLSATPA